MVQIYCNRHFYSSIGRRAAIMHRRYADAMPAYVGTYYGFVALKPDLVYA